MSRDIGRQHAPLASLSSREVSCQGMREHACQRSAPQIETLCDHRANDASQYITSASSSHARIAKRTDGVATLWFGPSETDGESLAELYLGELLPLVLDASKLAVVTGFHAEFGGKVRGNDVLCQEVVQPTSDGGSWTYSFDPWQHFPCQFTRSLPAGTPPKQSVLTILEMQQVFALKPGELTIHGGDSAESKPFRTTPRSQ